MKQTKLTIGQSIFLKPIGNMARGKGKVEPIEVKVATVGNKYFTVKDASERHLDGLKFYIESLLHNNGEYSSNYQGYLSKQAILDEEELRLTLQYIRTHVGTAGQSNLTLSQCRAISKIIKDEAVMSNLLTALQYAKKTIDEFEDKFPDQAHRVMGVDEMIFVETTLKNNE